MDSTTTDTATPNSRVRPRRPASVGRAVALLGLNLIILLFVLTCPWLHVPFLASLLIAQVIGWPMVLYVASRSSGMGWKENFPLRSLAPGLVLPVLVIATGSSILLIQLASLIPLPELMRRMEEQRASLLWPMRVVVGVILAPLFEEAFYRGWLFAGLRMRYSTRKAMVVSSMVFAFTHMNPWQAIIAFPSGIFFAWLVTRTGSLWPAMLAHAAMNAAGLLLEPLLRVMGHSASEIEEMSHLPPSMLATAGVSAVVGWCLLDIVLRRSESST